MFIIWFIAIKMEFLFFLLETNLYIIDCILWSFLCFNLIGWLFFPLSDILGIGNCLQLYTDPVKQFQQIYYLLFGEGYQNCCNDEESEVVECFIILQVIIMTVAVIRLIEKYPLTAPTATIFYEMPDVFIPGMEL